MKLHASLSIFPIVGHLSFDVLAFCDTASIRKSCSVDSQRCKESRISSCFSASPKFKRRPMQLRYSEDESSNNQHVSDVSKLWANVIDEYVKLQNGRTATSIAVLDESSDEDSAKSTSTDRNTTLSEQFFLIEESSHSNGAFNNEANIDDATIQHHRRPSVWSNSEERRSDEKSSNTDMWPADEFTIDDQEDGMYSTIERRKQRIDSLNSFNQAAKSQQQQSNMQQVHHRLQSHNRPTPPKLNLPYNDPTQLHAIQSNAPAILISSGPGTGKSHVLSLRIAYLLRMQLEYETNTNSPPNTASSPDSMVILSFTNRDAQRLKEAALDNLFPNVQDSYTEDWRDQTCKQLWSGTMHMFALAILRKYGYASSPLRVMPARAMRNRVSQCLRMMLNDDGCGLDEFQLNDLRIRHLNALNDVGQSRSIMFQNIVKCIDLWKEALLIPFTSVKELADEQNQQRQDKQKSIQLKNDCVELAMRLGIPKSSALLALDVFPHYQAKHAAAGTADPSDLAGMAYRLLLTNKEALHLLRSKLKHLIVDEYQDISVSQHALLRLIVRGKTDDDCGSSSSSLDRQQKQRNRSSILLETSSKTRKASLKKRPRANASLNQSYNVPNLFAAGDTMQSIYGWRAAAPSLTVDGFRKDYPQGVVAALGTCYRLPKDILEASSMLLDNDEESIVTSYDVSPAAANKVVSSIGRNRSLSDTSFANDSARTGESLLLSKGLKKLDSTVLIHGLWDSREEYKYIASTIRRRSKERRKAFISAMNDVDTDVFSREDQLDLTDVAIMVRSSSQLDMLKEELKACGVPFVVVGNNEEDSLDNDHSVLLERARNSEVTAIPMKPAMLMTMHRSKGEEFDDVYLAGWSEGSFPHPDAVSSNLIHEERRLGYVALTRARQRVVITHSLMSRTLHYSKDGGRKYVTSQVRPSRFLYELVPSKKKVDGVLDYSDDDTSLLSDNAGTVWNRNAGVKEYVAGQDVPDFFQKAYQQPRGSVDRRADLRLHTNINMKSNSSKSSKPDVKDSGDTSTKHNIQFVTGDKVVVMDKKHQLHRKTGMVKKVSKCFVFVKDLETDQTIRIKPTSLQLTSDSESNLDSAASLPRAATQYNQGETGVLSREEATQLESRLRKLTVQQLKTRLKRLKLPVSGRKYELINRLLGR